MKPINLNMELDFFDVYRRLSCDYFDVVERTISERLSPTTLRSPERLESASESIDNVLHYCVDNLKSIFPGSGIFWDDQREDAPEYGCCPRVVVDVVDGARNLQKGGTEVSSTLAIVRGDDIPLAIVSYPFGKERIVDVNGEVYWIPNHIEKRVDFIRGEIDRYRALPWKPKEMLEDFRVSERYDVLDDDIRERLDELRYKVNGTIIRPAGSLAKMLMAIVSGSCDVFITRKKNRPINFYDYLAPYNIIKDIGGVFTDLDGNEPDGISDMDGIIAGSCVENYEMFVGWMGGDEGMGLVGKKAEWEIGGLLGF
ncbi:hypothetical protein HOE04_03260 [archaeon]|jgi:fructose-1,6-bisphosphatase/inositol monophosphatase family enzyme|nr:hypothetical protein [archaeon]